MKKNNEFVVGDIVQNAHSSQALDNELGEVKNVGCCVKIKLNSGKKIEVNSLGSTFYFNLVKRMVVKNAKKKEI